MHNPSFPRAHVAYNKPHFCLVLEGLVVLQVIKLGRCGGEELKYSPKWEQGLIATSCLKAPAAVLLHTEVAFYIFEDWNSTVSVETLVTAKILISFIPTGNVDKPAFLQWNKNSGQSSLFLSCDCVHLESLTCLPCLQYCFYWLLTVEIWQ